MGAFSRMILLVALLAPRLVGAEPDADPSGHWEGTIEVPNQTVTIELDLAKNARGQLTGTIGNRTKGESGLPVATVSVAGRAVTVVIKATSGGGTFRGVVRDDGRSMSGEFVTTEGGHSLPFSVTRTGEARLAPPPKSPRIGKEIEGSWSGTLAVDGKQEALVLRMANQPDGTATGTLSAGDLTIPIAMTQKATRLHVEVPSISGTYDGVLNDARTELTGTWTQRSVRLPLTFRRTPK